MELVFQSVLLIVGLALLWKTGELSVRSALGFSAVFGIHQFTIGFFIFAISTGLPEIGSAIVASLNKVPELSVGDLVGSTFVNVSFILGVVVIMAKDIDISPSLKKKLFKSMAVMVLAVLWIGLNPIEGIVSALLLIGAYFGSMFWFQAGLPKEETKEEIREIEKEVEKDKRKSIISLKVDIIIKLFGSLGLLLLSSWIIVDAATNVASLLNINLTLLGGTVIALGTSFPELALAVHAIRRKEYGLALGDIFGSSLLNICFVIGLLVLMNPKIDLSFIWKLVPFIGVIFLWVYQALLRKKALSRGDGYLFLATFICYLGWSVYSYFSVV